MSIELEIKRNGETLCKERITKVVLHEFALRSTGMAIKDIAKTPVEQLPTMHRMFNSQNG